MWRSPMVRHFLRLSPRLLKLKVALLTHICLHRQANTFVPLWQLERATQ